MIHSRQTKLPEASRAQEYLEGWKRARAELDNFRKKVQEQRSADEQRNLQSFIEPFLSLADNFHAIADYRPTDLEGNAWAKGVLHVVRQLDGMLSDYGVERIEAVNVPFDPEQHEAVGHAEEGKGVTSNYVVEVLQPGYRLGATVLRPARVKVAK